MILIRTNLNISVGLGHYKRMLRLARELQKFGKKIVFLLDKPNYEFESLEFQHFYLYEKSNYLGEVPDAIKTIQFAILTKVTKIIVDDYRFGYKWEKKVKTRNVKLIVFDDDINKKHECDLYVNFKLLSPKELTKININLKNKKKLIGPKYSILNKSLKKNKIFSKDFNITFYAGGGGDPKIFYEIIKSLCITRNIKVKINLIISMNKNYLSKYFFLKKKYKNFNIINKDKYIKIMSKTNLYIGCQGNAIYENSYLKKLSIFFPIADNQLNDTSKLNTLGHYFSVKRENLSENQKILKLINNIYENYKRLLKESFDQIDQVDGLGALRIAKNIIGKELKIKKKYSKSLDKQFRIKKINLKDMHQYLIARNLKTNRSKMLNSRKIDLIDHYNWWLSDEFKSRETFKVSSEEKTLMFIWHKIIKINNSKYYIGGWFINSSLCKISDIVIALKWQLKFTKNKNIKWIAVINKKNKAVQKLNQLLGFKKEFNSNRDFLNAKSFFRANLKNFNYFIN